ncbi:ankyrin repeat-containing domain protein [Fusarium flagelliforme]|uniref:ankyrin repeat-containing domain protein n=1 Tax=Fusarium flagelliforme TaxID=2675880 RepID=UPI001E8E46F6|nr:ankyrin repeat-containing domain protein [Fusarium flagelliforme]KAH7173140.1 ankyrin repeat-containing domain protein [Fusarium flagelliforme]
MSPPAEDWSTITDANERRKAQNRVAQRNYRSRQKLRVEIAESILYDLPPQIRSAVTSKGRRWLTALQSESQELRELSAALNSQQAPGVREHDEQGNDITQSGAYPMLADTAADIAADSGDGDVVDLDLGMFTPGDDWIDPQMDWTAAMSLTGESSTCHSQARTVSPEASNPAPAPAPAPATTAPQPRPPSRPEPAVASEMPPPATVAPLALDITNRTKHRDSFYPVRSSLESKTPVMTAISRGKLDIARLLIGSGAKIDVPDVHGKTNLHYAVQRGDAKIAQSLLELGANVMATDKAGMTALHMAVEGDNEGMVNLLLECCQEKDRNASSAADQGLLHRCINSRDGENMTPVHLCVVMERVEILKILLHHGADVTIGCE